MAQVTLYLDESTQTMLEASAQATGMSKSRWVAELIRTNSRQQWPDRFLQLAGAFSDFPLDAGAPPAQPDVPRIGF
jgi:hypothetical protein